MGKLCGAASFVALQEPFWNYLLGLKRERFLDDERRRQGKCWFRIFLNPNLWVWLNAKMMCKRRSLTMHMNDRCRTYIGRWKGTWCGDYLRAENHFVLLSLFSNLFCVNFHHEVASWSRLMKSPHFLAAHRSAQSVLSKSVSICLNAIWCCVNAICCDTQSSEPDLNPILTG